MRTQRRVLWTLFLATVAVFSVNAGGAREAADSSGQRTLRFVSNTNGTAEQSAFEAVIAAFEQEYPGVTVEFEAFAPDAYYTVRDTRLASQEVDLFVINTSMRRNISQWEPLVRADRLVSLGDQPYIERFPDAILDGFSSVGDDVYGVLLTQNSYLAFYNVDIFAELGLQIPQTWDELLAAAEAADAAGYIPIALGNREGWPVALAMHAIGANDLGEAVVANLDELSFDEIEEEVAGAFERFASLLPFYSPGAAGQGYDAGFQQFASGQAAMTIDGSWRAAQLTPDAIDFTPGVFVLPVTDSTAQPAGLPAKADMILSVANTENADVALDFVEFIMRPEIHGMWNESMSNPPVAAGVSIDGLSELAGSIAGLAENAVPEWPVLVPQQNMQFNVFGVTGQMLTGDVESAAAAAALVVDGLEASQPDWAPF